MRLVLPVSALAIALLPGCTCAGRTPPAPGAAPATATGAAAALEKPVRYHERGNVPVDAPVVKIDPKNAPPTPAAAANTPVLPPGAPRTFAPPTPAVGAGAPSGMELTEMFAQAFIRVTTGELAEPDRADALERTARAALSKPPVGSNRRVHPVADATPAQRRAAGKAPPAGKAPALTATAVLEGGWRPFAAEYRAPDADFDGLNDATKTPVTVVSPVDGRVLLVDRGTMPTAVKALGEGNLVLIEDPERRLWLLSGLAEVTAPAHGDIRAGDTIGALAAGTKGGAPTALKVRVFGVPDYRLADAAALLADAPVVSVRPAPSDTDGELDGDAAEAAETAEARP